MTTEPRLVMTGRRDGRERRWFVSAGGMPMARPGLPPEGEGTPRMTVTVRDHNVGGTHPLQAVALNLDDMVRRWVARPW